MKTFFGMLLVSMLIASASFAAGADITCYKMRLGNYQTIDSFEGNNFNYLCITRTPESTDVSIYSGTGKNTLVDEFVRCTETKLEVYNVKLLDDSATTFFSPDAIICKHGLFVVYEKPVNDGKATKMMMGGLRYSLAYSSFELPVTGPTN